MHMEMIISFSIFIVFLLLLLLYIRPYERASFSEAIMDNLHEKFGNKVHVELIKFYLEIHGTDSDDCKICINLNSFPVRVNNSKSRVLDTEGNVFTSYKSTGADNGVLCLQDPSPNPEDCDLAGGYNVYLAEEFPAGSPILISTLSNENYSIGGIESKEYWAESEIANTRTGYTTTSSLYQTLKTELGLPQNVDFAIECLDCTESYNMTREIPDQSDVIASQYIQNILKPNGEIVERTFLFKIW